jgi:hypothetical protein
MKLVVINDLGEEWIVTEDLENWDVSDEEQDKILLNAIADAALNHLDKGYGL